MSTPLCLDLFIYIYIYTSIYNIYIYKIYINLKVLEKCSNKFGSLFKDVDQSYDISLGASW